MVLNAFTWCLLLALLNLCGADQSKGTGVSFVAAVCEPVSSEHLLPNITRKSALIVMNKNLDHFEEMIKTASDQKARIIVFPEYGITGFGQNRKTASLFGEEVPNPYNATVVPCHSNNNDSMPVLRRLSCLALQYNIVVVANIIAIVPCPVSDTHCPIDGRYQYNTNVAFNSSGQLVARYHKVNIYADEKKIFDSGKGINNYGVFKTDFATIGLFVCFDMLYPVPAVDLVYGIGIDTMVFSTAWMNELPLLSAIEYQQSWAMRYNVTLLASNQHLPLVKMTGSGIYSGQQGALTYHYDMVTYRSKLLIVNVPKRSNMAIIPQVRNEIISKLRYMDPKTLDEVSPIIRALLNDTEVKQTIDYGESYQKTELEVKQKPQASFKGVMNDDLYTFQPLHGTTGHVSICDGAICCHLNYTCDESHELYALGAFDGLHTHNGQYYLQTCSLVRCQKNEGTICGGEIERANVVFHDFSLRITGYNPAVYLFPEVVTHRINLPIVGKQWLATFPYDHIMSIGDGVQEPLLVASIYGRWYERNGDTVFTSI